MAETVPHEGPAKVYGGNDKEFDVKYTERSYFLQNGDVTESDEDTIRRVNDFLANFMEKMPGAVLSNISYTCDITYETQISLSAVVLYEDITYKLVWSSEIGSICSANTDGDRISRCPHFEEIPFFECLLVSIKQDDESFSEQIMYYDPDRNEQEHFEDMENIQTIKDCQFPIFMDYKPEKVSEWIREL